MSGMTKIAFFRILQQLQEQNLFIIGLNNEESELLEKQNANSKEKYKFYEEEIGKIEENMA